MMQEMMSIVQEMMIRIRAEIDLFWKSRLTIVALVKSRDSIARVCLFLIMLAMVRRCLSRNINSNGDEAQRPHPSFRPGSSLVLPRSFTGGELGQGVIQDDNGTTPSRYECGGICLETILLGQRSEFYRVDIPFITIALLGGSISRSIVVLCVNSIFGSIWKSITGQPLK
jgi:hypothetical protein